MHLHSGAASGLRPCLCGTGAAAEAPSRSPGQRQRRRGGSGGGCSGNDSVSFAGVLFLQFGEETRRVHITHEVSSLDTLHALIAHMFPQKLTMGMLKSPNTAILIKDEARNVFYELEDVRWAWPRGGWDEWAFVYSSSMGGLIMQVIPQPPPDPSPGPSSFLRSPTAPPPSPSSQPHPLPSKSSSAGSSNLELTRNWPWGRGSERGGGCWVGVLVAGSLRPETH